MEKRESKVKDLVEKLQIGEITSKDGLKELEKRDVLNRMFNRDRHLFSLTSPLRRPIIYICQE